MAALAAMTFHFGHGDALDSERAKRLPDLIELEWLYDCNDKFHPSPLHFDIIAKTRSVPVCRSPQAVEVVWNSTSARFGSEIQMH
jgi:hypothetical protein